MLDRKRWIVLADNDKILCRVMNCYIFKSIHNLGSAPIATFDSHAEAFANLRIYIVDFDSEKYKIVEVVERIEVI